MVEGVHRNKKMLASGIVTVIFGRNGLTEKDLEMVDGVHRNKIVSLWI